MLLLTLVRHAQAAGAGPSQGDFDRPLTETGRRDALALGQQLAAADFMPDRIVTSPAVRAMTTAHLIAQALRYSAEEIDCNHSIYNAPLGQLLEVVHTLSDNWRHVLLLGHNPAISDLANHLTPTPIGPLPTATPIHLQFSKCNTWQQITELSGKIA